MNILFISHSLPFPPNRGGKIRPFNMIQHLSKQHSVTVASIAESEDEIHEGAGLNTYCEEIIVEVLPISSRWKEAWKAFLRKTPSSVAYFWSPGLRRRIEDIAKKRRFDVIFVFCAFASQYAKDLKCRLRVIDFCDIDSAKWFDYAAYKKPPLSVGYLIEAKKLRRYEFEVAKQFDHCIVTTQGELEIYKTLNASVPCTVIPNGVDTAYFEPMNDRVKERPVIVFIGKMDYFPNVDGVLYFSRKIFPLIRQSIPEAEFRIIGSNPDGKVRRLASVPGITVTGHVPDIRLFLEDAAVSVAPLRIARGIQNKILESMAMGIPVVASPEAANGVDAVPGRHLLVGNAPESFAKQVITILKDPNLHKTLSMAGRRQVEGAHSWPQAMKVLDDVLGSSCRVG